MNTRRSILCGLIATSCALVGALAGLSAAAVADECPNAAFRTGSASRLPDCRAYELVSPADKNEGAPYLISYNPNGQSATLIISAATAGLEGFPNAGFKGPEAYYTTQRASTGWMTIGADPPSTEYLPVALDFAGESLDGLTTVWVERGVWQPGNSLGLFERRPDRLIVEVGPALPPTATPGNVFEVHRASGLEVQGVSADASHMLFSLRGDYWSFDGTESGDKSLYEYAGTGNATPMLVGVDQAGSLISKCGTELGAEEGSNGATALNAISMNNQTIFFTAKCGVQTRHELYARIDNGEPGARTVDISEPSHADCAACDTEAGALTEDAHFEGASQDGSKVFFSTTQPLLGADTSRNIYEYDFDAPAGERVVQVSASAAHAEVIEATHPLISSDGSHIYFLAHGVLTGAPNREGEAAEAGADNLYVFERDAVHPSGRVDFVARLSQEDLEQWTSVEAAGDVTPDGRFLVFTSERDLTPDMTTSGVRQVFEYDAQGGGLVRVSIGQDGFNNDGNVPPIPLFPNNPATYNNDDNAKIVVPGLERLEGAFYYPRYLSSSVAHTSISSDGSYVFFESTVGLTPQALDRKLLRYYLLEGHRIPLYADNVYEYHAGRVSLISDGQDLASRQTYYIDNISPVKLLGTDESGQDVLFTTTDKLVGQDTDTTEDIYDARIGGGFPPPANPPECSGEACQGALSGAPTLLSPGSEFQAGGNPPLAASTLKPAAKPKTRRKTKARKCNKRRKCAKTTHRKMGKAGNERRAKS